MTDTPILQGLSAFAASYDCVISDVWGVIHNGRDPYPAAAEALRAFRESRGPVVLLSNAPRLAQGVRKQFDAIGVAEGFYDAIMTSGKATRGDLKRRAAAGPVNIFYLGPDRDRVIYEGLDVHAVPASEAELIVCTGFYDDEKEAPDDYRLLLEEFKSRNLPFWCANPDLIVQRGDRLIYCAGSIAQAYEKIGGKAVYYGKPHTPVFHAALHELRAHGPATKPLVIGDGPSTDIKGANMAGFDALFIGGGIHGAETREDPTSMLRTLKESGLSAAAAMASLAW